MAFMTPGVMAAVSAVTTVASTAFSIANAQAQASNQSAWANYNAAVARNQAEQAKLEAEASAERKDQEWNALISKQRALLGAAGVDMSTGTPLEVLGKSAEEQELDRRIILWKGENAASQYGSQASIYSGQAANARAAGTAAVGQSLLTGAGGLVSTYNTYQSKVTQDKLLQGLTK